ncbi:MAG: TetR/AcrR family transcriptional regulator [Herbiconiux sp.]|uniref:TetR/AcrR family transcriptional regulator n=1 Tax=Herbiconiux sp. TaxID=1871186 RepID=UPI0012071D78|nr:TetR/AcrR family transcriptional regulator [Herbiconiux sp.]TAJ48004.1 MAG: TetR/AcrR family transcriptional regulator [Herbiconiux sp.]
MADTTPYRRSNLREALLDRAMIVLGHRGAEALSLRELARDLGVSHAAPARHFADRQRLLQALAVEGFHQLAEEISRAIASTPELQGQARRVAGAYVAFGIEKPNLVDVMFRHESEDGEGVIGASAAKTFEPLLQLFRDAEHDGVVPAGEAEVTATVFLAALQGIAALVNCGVVSPDTVPHLVDNAVPRFIASPDDNGRAVRS